MGLKRQVTDNLFFPFKILNTTIIFYNDNPPTCSLHFYLYDLHFNKEFTNKLDQFIVNDKKVIQYKEAASKIVKVMQFVLPLN